MTQEQKELLIKDLCARLDTNLVCSIYRIDDYGVGYRDEILSGYCKGDIWDEFYFGDDCGIGIDNVSKIKPYLFPLSSITDEQERELSKLGVSYGEYALHDDIRGLGIMVDEAYIFFEFCYKHHIDFLGLIEMGLAIDATGKKYLLNT